MTNEIVILYIIIMDEELTCNLCMKSFISHYALSLHMDIIHTFNYKCQTCESSENKGFMYSYFELLDHFVKVHGEDPFKILSYLEYTLKI